MTRRHPLDGPCGMHEGDFARITCRACRTRYLAFRPEEVAKIADRSVRRRVDADIDQFRRAFDLDES